MIGQSVHIHSQIGNKQYNPVISALLLLCDPVQNVFLQKGFHKIIQIFGAAEDTTLYITHAMTEGLHNQLQNVKMRQLQIVETWNQLSDCVPECVPAIIFHKR